jgi:hypothetical protein
LLEGNITWPDFFELCAERDSETAAESKIALKKMRDFKNPPAGDRESLILSLRDAIRRLAQRGGDKEKP